MYDIPSRSDVEMVTITRQAVLGEKPPTIKKRRPENSEDAA
jgi:ATP-dependent protease Clp ATPase subunit